MRPPPLCLLTGARLSHRDLTKLFHPTAGPERRACPRGQLRAVVTLDPDNRGSYLPGGVWGLVAPAIFKIVGSEHLGSAGSIPVRLRWPRRGRRPAGSHPPLGDAATRVCRAYPEADRVARRRRAFSRGGLETTRNLKSGRRTRGEASRQASARKAVRLAAHGVGCGPRPVVRLQRPGLWSGHRGRQRRQGWDALFAYGRTWVSTQQRPGSRWVVLDVHGVA